MPGKANTYTLGEFGVNRVLSPVHLIDGELLAAQNADVPFEKGNRGLRKRSGMLKHNESAAAGAILSMINIPIPDPLPDVGDEPIITTGDVMYVVTVSDAGLYQTSTDGTTWTTGVASIPVRPGGPTGGLSFIGGPSPNLVLQRGGFLTRTDGVYFLDAEDGHLMRWNGTALATLTSNTLADFDILDASALVTHAGDIYALGNDVFLSSNLFICKYASGAWEFAGASGGWLPQAALSAGGRLYVPNGQLGEMGYWTAADGFVNEGPIMLVSGAPAPTDMVACPWNSRVVTYDQDNAFDIALVWEQLAGTWSDVTPAAPNQEGCWGPAAMFGGVLYVARHTSAPFFTGCEVWSYDGVTMALDQDLTSVVTGAFELDSLVVFNGALYMYVEGSSTRAIVRRTSGGTYTAVINESSASASAPRREIGFF